MVKSKTGWFVIAGLALATGLAYTPDLPPDELKAAYLYPESGFFHFDGMQVHYRQTGEGPVLLLLHGVASSLHTWAGWHYRLSDRFRVVSLDLPGFGLTGPHPDGDYREQRYMHLLDALLDSLKAVRCHVAGNSFGGYLAWNYALHNPGRVDKLILVDAAGLSTIRHTGNIGFRLALNPLTRPFTHHFTPRLLVRKSVENVYGDKSKVTSRLVDRYYDLLRYPGNRQAFSTVLARLQERHTDSGRLAEIRQPVLIIWGGKDSLLPAEDAFRFDRLLPNSTLRLLPEAGHVPMEEQPVATARLARHFLAEDYAGH